MWRPAVVVSICVTLGSTACSTRASVDPRLLPGRSTALGVCRQWHQVAADEHHVTSQLVGAIRLANSATNANLVYVGLRDHMEAVRRAESMSDLIGRSQAIGIVNTDCRHIAKGKPPTGMLLTPAH